YLLPLAIALGAPLDARDVIVGNLIPTTLGNWVGGAVCVATVYAFAYGAPNKKVTEWWGAVGRRGGRHELPAARGGGGGAARCHAVV
ncbi:hypothetical protein MNEG_12953, partial [Monoraphidium neglectum]